MINQLNPEKVVQLLTKNIQQMDEPTLSALAKARQNALNRQSTHAPVLTLTPASAHITVRWADRFIPHSAQPWIAAGLLAIIMLAGTSYWQHVEEQQIDETDVAILTGDLPIEVFVN